MEGHMLSGWTSREGREGGTTGENHTHEHTHASLSAIWKTHHSASGPIQPKMIVSLPFFPSVFLPFNLTFFPLLLISKLILFSSLEIAESFYSCLCVSIMYV